MTATVSMPYSLIVMKVRRDEGLASEGGADNRGKEVVFLAQEKQVMSQCGREEEDV